MRTISVGVRAAAHQVVAPLVPQRPLQLRHIIARITARGALVITRLMQRTGRHLGCRHTPLGRAAALLLPELTQLDPRRRVRLVSESRRARPPLAALDATLRDVLPTPEVRRAVRVMIVRVVAHRHHANLDRPVDSATLVLLLGI